MTRCVNAQPEPGTTEEIEVKQEVDNESYSGGSKMATNRKRTKRKPKSAIPKIISEQYRKKLTLKDFLGQLEDHEIDVAAKAGCLRWDLWKKCDCRVPFPFKLAVRGWRLAPIFNGFGEIDTARYPDDTRFIINSYADLKAKMAEK